MIWASPVDRQDPDRSGIAPGGSRALVLIVEDEEPIAEALAAIIEDAGYRALLARNGKIGLELARLHHPALIITDLMMPYLDGAGLIAALRAEAAAGEHDPPPIVLTSAARRSELLDIPADAVMPKPFDLTEIERLLDRFLGRTRE